MSCEKNSNKKKNPAKKNIEEESGRLQEILKNAGELPSHTAHMRGLLKKKKHRCSSQKRKR